MKTLKIVPAYDGREDGAIWIERFRDCADTLNENESVMLPLAGSDWRSLSGVPRFQRGDAEGLRKKRSRAHRSLCPEPETVMGDVCIPAVGSR